MKPVWQFAAIAAVALLGRVVLGPFMDQPWVMLAGGVAAAVALLLAYRWIVRLTERRTVTELGERGAVSGLLGGTALGTVMFALVIGCIALLGQYHVDGWGAPEAALGLVGLMAVAAVSEELIFRGVLLRWIETRFGSWVALAVTAPLFGLMHLANPDASLWGATAIAIQAGAMLGAVYLATRSLWLPIGIHFGWNTAQSALFSTQVSGNDTAQGLLDAATSGPAAVSGGEFGPEASVFAVLAGAALTVVFLVIAHRRGRIVPARSRRAAAPADADRIPR
ncbi:CPBP family intramembrane glutamic endopeptidase [Glycomyces terrestris]|uniref:CPBP family intramembrane metalloprotease n=1 Tax=Glycomyces terrestris TaxID=2493553 RepID=A0A426UVW1_9ACTN|nr:CPBP family intramembrane glutamic endopeptidase [Glycomyces terrestris]RRR98485.1 CPBP family intramembrane metalloprotease [Glycomyces terrestris]